MEHYDLGNAFFREWLDGSMTYSSAVFAREDMSLEEAQREKYLRISQAAACGRGCRSSRWAPDGVDSPRSRPASSVAP